MYLRLERHRARAYCPGPTRHPAGNDTKMPELKSTEMYFPTLLWRFELAPDVRDKVNKRLIDLLTRLEPNLAALPPGTGRQTDPALHTLAEMEPLVTEIENAVKLVLEFLDVVYERSRITGCWANVNAVQTHHREHIHPNNYLSGVYYVQADEGANSFSIDDPRPQRHMIKPRVSEFTPFNAAQFTLSVKPGDMLVFPAWLPHSVDFNRSKRVRISVSFNAMFENFAETMSAPEWSGTLKTTSFTKR
jgi:uncharacterized protein (TIGR02466 family)